MNTRPTAAISRQKSVLSNLLKVLNGSPFPRTMKSLENSHAILLLLVETKARDFLTHDKRLDLFVCLFVVI